MAEYIERDKAKELICNYGKGAISDGMKTLDPVDDIVYLCKSVGLIPSADVAPVVHGNWSTHSDRPDTLICSVCNCGFDMWKHDRHNFCPECGAKMDLED